MRMRTHRGVLALLALAGGLLAPAAQAAPELHSDVFGAFTAHIQRQVDLDKRVFVEASECTQWFYRQERGQQPRPPSAEGVRFDATPARPGPHLVQSPIDCAARYPGGLRAAREDFSQSQSTLSLSLTFYEFALVADRDDDQRYGESELRDLIESFGLTFNPGLPSALQASTLNGQFDSIHTAKHFDLLMSGMSTLFERGYRFSFRDKEALNRIMG